MPIIKSAKKALRSSKRKRVFNLKKKDQVSKSIKTLKKFVADKNIKEAQKFLSHAQKVIDKATKTGLLKKNTASRRKSHLASLIKKAK